MEIFVVSEKNVKYAQHLAIPNSLFPTGTVAVLFPQSYLIRDPGEV